jgi:hypothetical protein
MATGDARERARSPRPRLHRRVFSQSPRNLSVWFRTGACEHTRVPHQGDARVDASNTPETIHAELTGVPGRHHLLPCTWTGPAVTDGNSTRTKTSLAVVLLHTTSARGARRTPGIVAPNAGKATTNQRTTGHRGLRISLPRQRPREAANPVLQSLAVCRRQQEQQSESDMPLGAEDRNARSNLMFQPYMLSVGGHSARSGGCTCVPVVTIVNSVAQLDQNGQSERRTGSATPSLEWPRARPLLAAARARRRPDVRVSTASGRELGQGHLAGAVLMSEPRCSARTSSPTASCSNGSRWRRRPRHEPDERRIQLHLHLANGYTIGTQPNLSVNWEAPENNRVGFSIGRSRKALSDAEACRRYSRCRLKYYNGRFYAGLPSGPTVEHSAAQATPTMAGPHHGRRSSKTAPRLERTELVRKHTTDRLSTTHADGPPQMELAVKRARHHPCP